MISSRIFARCHSTLCLQGFKYVSPPVILVYYTEKGGRKYYLPARIKAEKGLLPVVAALFFLNF